MAAVLSAVPVLASGGTVAVPAGAQAVVAFWVFYRNSTGQGINALSLGGASAFTVQDQETTDPNFNAGGVATALITTTGNQTFTYSFQGAPQEGPSLWLVFVNEVDTSALVRQANVARDDYEAASASVTSTTTDLVLAFDARYGATAPPAVSGWTSLGTSGQNSAMSRVSRANSPGASSTSYTSGHTDFPLVAVISLRNAPGGGSPTSVQQDYTATYAVLAPVSADFGAAYGVLAPVSQDLIASYAVLGSVSQTLTASYAVIAPVQTDYAASYAVAGPVQSDFTASYAVLAQVTRDYTSSYNVVEEGLTPVSNDFTASYAVRALVSQDFSAGYAVRTPVDQAYGSAYAVLASAEQSYVSTYSVTGTVDRSFTYSFSLTVPTGVSGVEVEYTADGSNLRFVVPFPFLSRGHVFVTVNGAPRAHYWPTASEIELTSPCNPGDIVRIFRVTPDTVGLAEFKDASNLSKDDLNRARLQLLYLIQERSAGLGNVAGAFNAVAHDLDAIGNARNDVEAALAALTAGLATLDDLSSAIPPLQNAASALLEELNNERNRALAAEGLLDSRVTSVETAQAGFGASVTAVDIARINGDEALAASIESLEATVETNDTEVRALINDESEARANADSALASQITSLEASVDGDIASLQAQATAIANEVDGVQSQWVLKTEAQRGDGKRVFAGVGVAAVATDEIQQSEIVMQADRFVLVPASNINDTPTPIMVAGTVNGAPTIVFPASKLGDQTVGTRVLVDGSVSAGKFLSGTSGKNMLTNSGVDPYAPMVHWVHTAELPPVTFGYVTETWAPPGQASVFAYKAGFVADDERFASIFNTGRHPNALTFPDAYYPVEPGKRYEFHAWVSAHRAKGQVCVQFFTTDGVFISEVRGTQADGNGSGNFSPISSSTYGGFATAPAGAALARWFVRCAGKGDSEAYVFVARGYFGEAFPNQTELSPWSPAGRFTSISGDSIITGTVSANKLNVTQLSAITANVGLLRTASSGARMEIENNQQRVYDGSGNLRVVLGQLV